MLSNDCILHMGTSAEYLLKEATDFITYSVYKDMMHEKLAFSCWCNSLACP